MSEEKARKALDRVDWLEALRTEVASLPNLKEKIEKVIIFEFDWLDRR